jgi:hypothetical protein
VGITGSLIRFSFAYSNTNPFYRARPIENDARNLQNIFQVARVALSKAGKLGSTGSLFVAD